jgi:hypothetical protein
VSGPTSQPVLQAVGIARQYNRDLESIRVLEGFNISLEA